MKKSVVHISIFCILAGLVLPGCREEERTCPEGVTILQPPYDNPIWHPEGSVIGYNHRPIKEIRYRFGVECPLAAEYTYDDDNAGFWLVNADGTNPHRIWPEILANPAWSPDGEWILFDQNSQIFKMRFEDGNFDQSSRVQLTEAGVSSLQSAWSPDGNRIAYASNADDPNSIFNIWLMNEDGSGKTKLVQNSTPIISNLGMPHWLNADSVVSVAYQGGFGNFGNKLIMNNLVNDDETSILVALKLASPKKAPGKGLISFLAAREGMERESQHLSTIELGTKKTTRVIPGRCMELQLVSGW